MPGSKLSPMAPYWLSRPPARPITRTIRPVNATFAASTLDALRADPPQTHEMDMNDILLTLCTFDRDIRYRVLERVADVVAAGLALQFEREEAEFQKSAAQRARREKTADL